MASMLKLPPGMWITSRRPYFTSGMRNLQRNLPWGFQNIVRETERNHSVFEESGFELGPVLGTGTFSTVVMGYWKHYKLNVAVKIYSKKKNPALKMLPTEINMLKLLKHPNIVAFFGAWETQYRVYLVLELVGKGNLLEYILENGFVSEEQAKTWFAQLMSALVYAHSMECAHRDIKCENILLDMELKVRLSDFGFATPDISWSEDIPNSGWTKDSIFCGSTAYMAPEIFMRKPFSPLLADVWAVGVVLYALLFGKFPLGNYTVEDILDMVEYFQLPDTPELSIECQEVFQCIFVLENDRIRSTELLEMPWISEKTVDIDIGRNAKLTFHEVENERERNLRMQLALQETSLEPEPDDLNLENDEFGGEGEEEEDLSLSAYKEEEQGQVQQS